MSKSASKFNFRQRIFLIFLGAGLLTGSLLINYRAEAKSGGLVNQKNNSLLKSFSPLQRDDSPAINIGERTSVWLKLEQGKSSDTTFYGYDAAIAALQNNQAEPTGQVSADINADGYADLISGFRNAAGGGLIALHRARQQAFEPTDKRTLAILKRGGFPATFEKNTLILSVPTAPDFIAAGKFSEDSAVALVFAARGGRVVYLMTSDGKGGFNEPQEITVNGEITALAADTLDASKTYTGLAVALKTGKSSSISVFDGTAELLKTAPHEYQVKGSVSSLILANPAGATAKKDIFGLADGEIFTIGSIENPNSAVSRIELPFRAADIAVGEFIRDRELKTEIAVLSEAGDVSYLTNGTLDTRPFTTDEVIEQWQRNGGRGRSELTLNKTATDNLSNVWSVAETHQLGVYESAENYSGGNSPVRILQKAYITGNETDDLLVVNPQTNRVQILFKEPNTAPDRTSLVGDTKLQNIDFAESPVSVLPMRLNVMGQQGFVFFSKGNLEPTLVMLAPNATFTVSKTADTNDGVCNADCSLREAVRAANAAAGADMITFAPNGTYQLTINNVGVENAAVEGDLDITQALTIVGNGTGNTVITAGTTTVDGIDKVLSVNPNFDAAFATSFSNFTVRFGRNPSTFSADGFGGGFDWEASGTGTLTVSGVTVDSNSTLDGDGGGIVATSAPVGSGVVSITNSTISSNNPGRTGNNSPIGGGIFVGQGVTYRLTNTTLSGNSVVGGNNQGQGGAIYAFGPASSAGKSFLTGSTIMSNSAPSDGGGVYSLQALDINAPTIIRNNSSGRSGGGIFLNHSNATTVMSKSTLTGNSATLNGGAVYLGTSTTANVLNMSFSRIVGNTAGTFSGLVTTGGIANVENNWWGCNTGPSAAPCDTAGASGGTVDFDPWLRFTHTASPNTIVVGQRSTLTASFLTNSSGQAIAASNLDVLIGLPIIFNNAVRGTLSGTQLTIQANGTATANFTGTSPGAGSANAAVENGTATATLTINQAGTATFITAESADPSTQGQPFTVFYAVTVNAPGAGTPTGNVTVSDGVDSCVGTVAAGQCNLTLSTAGERTLTATYAGDANFSGSVSPGEPHTVVPLTAASVEISGRVTTTSGRGLTRVRVTITDQSGNSRQVATNPFGYFRFADVQAGQTYIVSASARQYIFASQLVTVNETLTNLNFIALE